MGWFLFDNSDNVACPFICSSRVIRDLGIGDAEISVQVGYQNLTSGQEQPDIYNMRLRANLVRQHVEITIGDGLSLLTLYYGQELRRTFCFFKPAPYNERKVIHIYVKHNTDDELVSALKNIEYCRRTKIRVVSPVRIPEGRLCFTVAGCPIPFRFPAIEAGSEDSGQCFVIERPQGELSFFLQDYKPPLGAELYPPECERFSFGLECDVQIVTQ